MAFKDREKLREYIQKWKRKLKEETLIHYGNGKCVCVVCGEKRLGCLSIDHINNDGAQHKRALGKYGVGFYSWLRKNNYPEGYQTLCMNCQFLKERRRINNENLMLARFPQVECMGAHSLW